MASVVSRRWSHAASSAGEIVKLAAAEVGGGGGGRDTLARAGGRDPAGLPKAFEVALGAIETALGDLTSALGVTSG